MAVIEWLLEGDPAIRWQVLRDLTDASPGEVAAERARVSRRAGAPASWRCEGADGLWEGGACFPAGYTGGEPGQPWTATMHTLQTLQIFGLDPVSDAARHAVALVAEHGRWEHDGQRYFDGEVEPCINGRTIETGAYFGVDVAGIVERILGERLADGGWNCEAENGSVRSSFDTTINVLDGLLEYERATGGSASVRAGPPRRGAVPARAQPVPSQEHRGGRRSGLSRLRLPVLLALRRAARPRLLPRGGRGPGSRDGRSRRGRAVQASSPTGVGCSTASIRVVSTSTSRTASERPAGGTPCAPSGCSTGGTKGPARRRDRRPLRMIGTT